MSSFDDLPSDEPYPGVKRHSIDADQATLARYAFAPGARFPTHHHPEEQIVLVRGGSVTFSCGDRVEELGPGEFAVAAPGVDHSMIAGADGAEFVAIIVPRREHANAYTVTGTTP
jgi:quercetin dioxygenase-like cupin family protein